MYPQGELSLLDMFTMHCGTLFPLLKRCCGQHDGLLIEEACSGGAHQTGSLIFWPVFTEPAL